MKMSDSPYDNWLDHLTAGRTDFTIEDLDLESSPDELFQWVKDNFPNAMDEPCYRMGEKLNLHRSNIRNYADSHPILINAHWNLVCLAEEGHYGFGTALSEIEMFWAKDVQRRSKRGLSELQGEIWRSRTNAIRKIKYRIEDRESKGMEGIPPNDPQCCGASAILLPVNKYDTTDRGNARQLKDMKTFDGKIGIHYISDWKQWIIWIPSEDGSFGRWQVDEEDGGLIRRAWCDVEDRQKMYVENLKAIYDAEVAKAIAQSLPARGNAAAVPPELILARNNYEKWKKFTDRSGSKHGTDYAIGEAAGLEDITISSEQLDSNRNILAVKNGILDFTDGKIKLRKQTMEDLVTMNTRIVYDPKIKNPDGERMWNNFLDVFIPDLEKREIIQTAMGYSLIGGNKERVFLIALGLTSTGKSTFASLCCKALGDYGAPVGKTMFQGHKFKPSLTRNKRKRLVINTEFDGNTTVSTAAFKEITGGSDGIETEVKGVDRVLVSYLHFTPLVATNQMMNLDEPDVAVERRVYILPYEETISPEDEKTDFGLLLEEIGLDVVLAWMIDGLKKYLNGGLIRNELTERLRRQAMRDISPYQTFIDECILKHDDHNNHKIPESVWTNNRSEWCVNSTSVFNRFRNWWSMNYYQDREAASTHAFTKMMKSMGLRRPDKTLRVGKEVGRFYLGIKLINDPNEIIEREWRHQQNKDKND